MSKLSHFSKDYWMLSHGLPCERAIFGWVCMDEYGHRSPCAVRPAWWNMTVTAWRFRRRRSQ